MKRIKNCDKTERKNNNETKDERNNLKMRDRK